MTWRPYIQLLLIIALLFTAESMAVAASNKAITVSVTVLSSNNCRFSAPGTTTLAFGNLDPTNPIPVAASATLGFRCGGSDPLATFFIFSDNGRHFSGGKRRMQNPSDLAAYIPYELTLTPATATVPRNSNQLLTINGDIAGADYRFATAGILYADHVILSINP